jgi:hypothetical protein
MATGTAPHDWTTFEDVLTAESILEAQRST